ncbi:uncharacterized protein LOC143534943 isoform X2 [Bidens hawaiensis]|uniref:uncharacterized protein LOC143534943 isoform X2 n=1 Tax=Bidens hawaiensis TaxID=980011 RepID=UPI00404AB3F2
MTEEHDAVSPPEEEEPTEHHSEETEDDDDDDVSHLPPLLDIIEFPPALTLPPTPPFPCSPTDLEMEEQDSDEDDGPPPGWNNRYQLKEQAEQLVTLADTSAVSSDIHMQTENARKDAHNEEGEPLSQAHPCLPPEVALSVEEQDSEDDGPPPGWDSKSQHEPKLQETLQSDMKMEDAPQDAQNAESQPTPEAPTVDQEESEDEGPPPGWDSKCQLEPMLQKAHQSDMKMKQDGPNDNGPQSQSHSCSSPVPEVAPSDIKVDEQDSEDGGPPPGWNSKCQPEPNLKTACPTTPPSDFNNEEDKRHALDNEGFPPGWESTPQQQPHVHSTLPSPIVQSGNFQPPSRQQSIYPTKPQISAPKPPMPMNNPEMGQMVCGSCRHLLSYPKGARYVECACCLEDNYVLEEHEVGQVVCGGCNVLLMYPYGAPKVRCANCRAETEIGDQNRRPSLFEHKRRARQHLRRVHAG